MAVKQWRIWKAADALEEKQTNFYPNVTPKVVSILREWGSNFEGKAEWKSLLDKQSFLHEAEESIIAIHHLLEEVTSFGKSYIAADVCGGKGLFSFLLSYFKPDGLETIILLEKADIDYYHIEESNLSAQREGRPLIEIWGGTNLHEYDLVLDRFLELPFPVALTGIHLCKQLSPSFCSLVNGLGKRCIYALLAPCCLPRAITAQKWHPTKCFTISINRKETHADREARRDYMERRERLKRKPSTGPCFLCKEEDHNLKDCNVLPTLAKSEQESIRKAWHAATIPCWNCLEYGHFKDKCPIANNSSNRLSRQPPVICLEVSGVLQQTKPFTTYCHLLAKGFEDRQSQIIETDIENQAKHQQTNWNSERKSIFILVK